MGKISHFNLPVGGEKRAVFSYTPEKGQLYLPKIIGKNKIREGGGGLQKVPAGNQALNLSPPCLLAQKKRSEKSYLSPYLFRFFLGGGVLLCLQKKREKTFLFSVSRRQKNFLLLSFSRVFYEVFSSKISPRNKRRLYGQRMCCSKDVSISLSLFSSFAQTH